jgi:serine protease AprX
LAGSCLVGVASATAQNGYIDASLKRGGHSAQHVIITVQQGHEGEVLDRLKHYGASVTSQHPSINGVAATIQGDYVSDLAKHGVISITPDAIIHASGAPVPLPTGTSKAALDPNAPQDQVVSTLRLSLGLNAGAAANLAPSVINGTGVGIAIVDSGIIRRRLRRPYQGLLRFHEARPVPSADAAGSIDDLGHGTHRRPHWQRWCRAGSCSGRRAQCEPAGVQGPRQNGAGSTSSIIAAQMHRLPPENARCSDHQPLARQAITAPAKFDPLVQAVESASAKGLIVVVAAGNDGPGYGSINSPANAPSAITVGVADGKTTVARNDDYVPSFSSRGPTWYDGLAKPDVVAPGVNLYSDASPVSTLVNSTNPVFPQLTVDGVNLLDLSGSSMSAAVATGVIALELDANAHQNREPLTVNAAKAILEYTSVPVANADYLTQGAAINAAGAVSLPADRHDGPG